MAKKKTELSTNDVLFIKEYLSNGGNGTAAYQIVYGQPNKAYAASQATNKLKQPLIKEYIDNAKNKVLSDAIWSSEEIIKDLKNIAIDTTNPLGLRLNAYALGLKAISIDKAVVSPGVTVNTVVQQNNGRPDMSQLSDEELRKRLSEYGIEDDIQ